MTSTALMRQSWAPACAGPFSRVAFHGAGVATVKATTVPAWRALNHVLIEHDYETRKEDTGAYNCRKITGGSNYSLHAYGIAVDINWQSNPYGPRLITDMPIEMIKDIEKIRTRTGHQVFRWGGRYAGNKDAMHFEIICTPSQLATGIATKITPKPSPEPHREGITMEAALELIRVHYRNARGSSYDVSSADLNGWQHWVTALLSAFDNGQPLKHITDQCGGLLFLEMSRR